MMDAGCLRPAALTLLLPPDHWSDLAGGGAAITITDLVGDRAPPEAGVAFLPAGERAPGEEAGKSIARAG